MEMQTAARKARNLFSRIVDSAPGANPVAKFIAGVAVVYVVTAVVFWHQTLGYLTTVVHVLTHAI
jgi:hypothetical protein